MAVHLRWGPLLTGRFVGDVVGEGVKVVLEQPKPGGTGVDRDGPDATREMLRFFSLWARPA